MEKLLDIKLYVYKTLVFGEIVHQDESLRRRQEDREELTVGLGDGFSIVSSLETQLRTKTLYVKGSRIHDTGIFHEEFPSESEALMVANKIKSIVDKVNEKEVPMDNSVVKIM